MLLPDAGTGKAVGQLYTKHCSSDCMADAIGGGYGEKLGTLLGAIRSFMQKNKGEIVLLPFSHFCERETPVANLADSIITRLGNDLIRLDWQLIQSGDKPNILYVDAAGEWITDYCIDLNRLDLYTK